MLMRPNSQMFGSTLLMVRGSSLSLTWPWLVMLSGFALFVTVFIIGLGLQQHTFTTTPFTLVGLALSIFLGFRNNACYDRWWEARKLWGRLINTTRSFARQVLTLVNAPEGADEETVAEVRAFQVAMIKRMIAYTYTLKGHLRTQMNWSELHLPMPDEEIARVEGEDNVPIAVLQILGDHFRVAWKRGWIHAYHLPVLEQTLFTLTDIQGGCERIKNTPVPLTYTILTHRIVAIYCLALPFGLVDTVGWLTPLVTALVAFAFLGLDSVGTQIEDPFELDANDLPLSSMSRTIEINLLQRIQEPELPVAVRPVEGILL